METKIPDKIKELLESKFPGKEWLSALQTDVTSTGAFGEEWFFINNEDLAVAKESGGSAQLVEQITLNQVKDARAVNMVGGGALEIEYDSKVHRILLYSNARAHEFTNAARIVNELVKEHRFRETTEERKRRYCPKCGKPIAWSSDVCPRCVKKRQTFFRLFQFTKPYLHQIMWIFFVMVSATFAGLIIPYISKVLIDDVLTPKRDMWRLAPLALSMFAARAASVILGALQARESALVGSSTVYDIRAALYKKLQNLSISYYDKRHTGALMTRVNSDTGEAQNFMVSWLPALLQSSFQIIGIGVLLFVLSWKLTLYIIMPVFFTVWFVRVVYPRVWVYFHRFYEKRSRMSATVSDTLTGIRVVKAFGQEEKETNRFNEKSQDLCDAAITLERKWTIYNPIMSITRIVGVIVVWYVGGKYVFDADPKKMMTLGSIVAYASYLEMFYGPIFMLTDMARVVTHSLSAGERILEVLDAKSEVEDAPDSVSVPRIKGGIEFRNVTFGYNKLRPVLKNFSLVIKENETIGIVGKSGSGKTTLISLLSRLYDVDEGEILIDGINIKKIRYDDLRRQIGVVLQEPFLFSGTIAENIAYSKPGAELLDIVRAAKAANAHDFMIVTKPDGYDTYVGERGGRLSLGERQRVSIARAILHDPRILILDEATSSVDTETEKEIQDALYRLIKGRTTIAIAHRLSTLRNSDRIVVLEEGKLAEQGSHDELMAMQGVYYKLVQIQSEIAKSRIFI